MTDDNERMRLSYNAETMRTRPGRDIEPPFDSDRAISIVDRAAKVLGEVWWKGGGEYVAGAPSWGFMARALDAAGLLIGSDDE